MDDLIVAVIVAALGGGGAATVIVKLLDRGRDNASAKQTDVQTLRDIIAEVRADKANDDQRIEQLEKRVGVLEERERHMLTRAAVHEAWDQLAFQVLLAANPDHPPPPPLRPLVGRRHDDPPADQP